MADESQRPIHVKKIKKASHGHHGGAWKIAYADFITAMMAFFLLLWLLSSVSQGTLNGVSEYFKTPLRVALMGGKSAADASSPIKGGGQDLTRQDGQRKKTEEMDERQKEKVLLAKLQARIKEAIEKNKILNQYKNQLLLEMTPEGLRIQIIDEKNRPMFDSGSSRLLPHTKDLLQELGRQLNEVQNRLSISGHTDAAPYSAGDKGFSNWELSSDRANAARRELVVGGMDDSKVLRVVGLASTVLFDKNDPLNSVNRRISIVVLNRKTEQAILQEEGPESEAGGEEIMPDGLKLPGVGKGTAG